MVVKKVDIDAIGIIGYIDRYNNTEGFLYLLLGTTAYKTRVINDKDSIKDNKEGVGVF